MCGWPGRRIHSALAPPWCQPLGPGGSVLEVHGGPIGARPGARSPARRLLDGLAMVTTDGPAAAAPVLRRALIAFGDEHLTPAERVSGHVLARRRCCGL